MGGAGEPTVHITLKAEISGGGSAIEVGSLLLPDLVDGQLSGTLGSVGLCNDERERRGALDIQSENVCASLIS